MSMQTGPSWSVQAADPLYACNHAGADPLGMRLMHDKMVGNLLPGITAQTRRARYYVFYAWAMHQIRKMRKRNLCSFKRTMYDLERLFMLSCVAHEERAADSGSATAHAHITGSRMGRYMLAKHDDEIPLDFAFAGDDLGGYGMYYQDSMLAMGLSDQWPEDEYERPTPLGVSVSDTFDGLASGLELASYCERASIQRDVLYEMGEKISLCQIKYNTRETRMMIDILFGLADSGDDDDGGDAHHNSYNPGARPKSLALALYAINQSGLNGHTMDSGDFADAACLGCIASTTPRIRMWPLPELQHISERWGTAVAGAHRNISFSAEVLFQILLNMAQRHNTGGNSTPAAPDYFARCMVEGLDGGLNRALRRFAGAGEDTGGPHTMRGITRLVLSEYAAARGWNPHDDVVRTSRLLGDDTATDPPVPETRITRMMLQYLSSRGAAYADWALAAASCVMLVAVTSLRLLWRLADDANNDACIRWYAQMDAGGSGTLDIARDAAAALVRDTDAKEFARMFIQRHVVRRASGAHDGRMRIIAATAAAAAAENQSPDNANNHNGSSSNLPAHTYHPAYGRGTRFESMVSIFEDLGLVQSKGGLRCTAAGQRVLGRVLRSM